jgi:gliding motility-associated-like protein
LLHKKSLFYSPVSFFEMHKSKSMLSVSKTSCTLQFFIVTILLCAFTVLKAQQPIWKFKPRSISFTEGGKKTTTLLAPKKGDTASTAARTNDTNCPTNIDFEQGNFTNWQCYTGSVTQSGGANVVSVSSSGPVTNRHTIMTPTTTPATDNYGLFPVICPSGGSYSVKLGNNSSGSQAERIRYTFTIPAGQSDFNFVYNYAVVFQDPSHPVVQQPRFQAKIYDALSGDGVACANYDFTAAANLPGFQYSPLTPTGTRVLYKPWTSVTINLSGLGGRTMILEFTTADCTVGGHFGYAYVDVNSVCTGLVSGATVCNNASSVTLNAPPGYQNYIWYNADFSQQLGTGTTLTLTPPPPVNTNLNIVLVPFPGFGCTDTAQTSITASASPVAGFNVDTTPVCLNANNFAFTNTSSITTTANLSYLWKFGDNTSSTLQNPTHSYTAIGNYVVKLIARSSIGNCIDSTSKTVQVGGNPVAKFDTLAPIKQCVNGNNFIFKNSSPTFGSAVNYEWDFGDGFTSTTMPIENHTYAQPGTYTIKLRVQPVNYSMCKDSMVSVVTVYDKPNPLFTINGSSRQCIDNNVFSFTNNSTIASNTTLAYSWNFGDASFSSITSPQHNYATANTFGVTLVATSNNNCKDSITLPIIVDARPQPNFSIVGGNEQCFRDNMFSFLNNTTIPTGTFSQTWNFGDASASNDANPLHHYTTGGSYTVQLITVSDRGCKDSISKTVATNPNPTSLFGINDTAQCLRANNFVFTNNSTIATGSNTYTWNFGDATNSTAASPIKNYSNYSTVYTVQLIANSNKGCSDTTFKNVYLYQHPTTNFTIASNTEQCQKSNLFILNNTSSFPTPISYQWSFGDGSLSTQTNESHQYTTFNNYTITLVATTAEKGCTDTMRKPIAVYKNPGSTFTINNSLQCFRGNNFVFGNTPTGSNYAYNWSFGDGTTDNTGNPTHNYTSVNNYSVQLIVNNIASPTLTCSDTVSKPVSIRPEPIGTIVNKGNNFLCQDDSLPITANGGVSYQWFKNGVAISNATNSIYQALHEGIYTVDVTNQFGCTSTSPDTAFVVERKKPQPDFSWDSYCINKAVQFANSTNVGANNLVNYTWYFGDNATSILPTPLHTYTNAKLYVVKLIASSTLCPNHIISKQKTFRIEQPPTPFRYTTLHAVVGNTYTLNARTIGASYAWLPVIDLTAANTRTPLLKPTAERNYTVKITTPSGCETTDSLRVMIFKESDILVPKAFTPNNDGLNDILYAIPVGIKEFKFMRIYNRWGNLVFTTNNEKMGWNGEYKSQPQPTETYTWVAEAIDDNGNIIKRGGNTILIR